jgi:hypothetical protein
MRSGEFELILVCSKDDAPPFSDEYQEELGNFSRQAHASSQICFAMDGVDGGGGPLGDFIFNNSGALITALTTIGVAWLHARYGRKLKLKYIDPKNGPVEIEANTLKEVEAMVKQVHALSNKEIK